MITTKALRFWLAAALLAAPLLAAKVESPRCEPLEVGTETTLEAAAASIAMCPVEHALAIYEDTVALHTIGTENAAIFPKPHRKVRDRIVIVHNHPHGNLEGHAVDRCAAITVRQLHIVTPDGAVAQVPSLGNPGECMKLQHKAMRKAKARR